MKGKPTIITDLSDDVLKYIMILVAKNPDGAATIARAIPVCKLFKKLVHQEEVLKVVAFDNLKLAFDNVKLLFHRLELFQQCNGLLRRCVLVGNENAEHLFSKNICFQKLILLSCGELLLTERQLIILEKFPRQCESMKKHSPGESNIIADLRLKQSTIIEFFSNNPFHNRVVIGFLHHCSPDEFFEMEGLIRDYFHYFIKGVDLSEIMGSIAKMCDSYTHLRDLKTVYTIIDDKLELGRMETNANSFLSVLDLAHDHLFEQLLLECGQRGLNYRLISQGDLEELDGAYRKLIADFEMRRSHAISVINSFFM